MNSKEMYKALIKAYTGRSLHDAMTGKLILANYESVQYFLSAYIDCVGKSSFLYSYKNFNQPVFRALEPNEKFDL